MKLTLDKYLPYRLSVASNKVSALVAKTYQARFGLSIAAWRVLAILNEKSPLSQLEITQFAAMDKVSVSRAVSALLERSLIVRKIAENDKRTQSLSLSHDGQSIVDEIIPLAKDIERQLIEALGAEKSNSLASILREIEAAAEKIK
ncbi:MAG: MarR family transcriptional regulator [Hyphomonadaceae bacterium]|nr:MAG: MarR family transcriptional regulator [Hyphomonadaceae bacterium]KAF0184969.1 MAG: MarR family transcriptional regulator [Hyphomonadaceae bacterium]